MPTFVFPGYELLTFAASYFLLAMTPGPNFALVTDAALTASREHALSAALGVAIGAGLLAGVVALSTADLTSNDLVRQIVKTAFAAYLFYLAYRSWVRNSSSGGQQRYVLASNAGYFRLAVVTAVANPATAIFFASSSVRNGNALGSALAISAVVFLLAILWFGLVATVASSRANRTFPQIAYARMNLGFALVFMTLAMLTLAS